LRDRSGPRHDIAIDADAKAELDSVCHGSCAIMALVRDRVLRDALSIGVATGVYGVSFGVLSRAAGFTVAQTCVMSLVAFTGASQFTFVAVMGAGGGLAAALPPAVLLAARNGIYALSLGAVLRRGRLGRALDAHLVIDESTAMALAQRDDDARRRGFPLTALAILVCWNAGTLAGALAGRVLGDPRALGLDAIFPAVFLALLAPQMRSRDARAAAVAGAAIAVVLLHVAPAGVPVMASVLAAAPLLRRRSRS
jgi:4-azaleucine resistance transporter AzlC